MSLVSMALLFHLKKSYLEERTQAVSALGFHSDPSTLLYDVPQGSLLGPILFILYTQPLSDIIARNSVLHHMFADDTELYKSVSRDKILSLLNAMQRCVAGVKLWTIHNKLQLIQDKTEALLTSLSVSADLPLNLKIGHNNIQFFCFSSKSRCYF